MLVEKLYKKDKVLAGKVAKVLGVGVDQDFVIVMQAILEDPIRHVEDIKKYVKAYHYSPYKKYISFERKETDRGSAIVDEKSLTKINKHITLEQLADKLKSLGLKEYEHDLPTPLPLKKLL